MLQIDPRGRNESMLKGSGEGWSLYDEYIIRDGNLLPKAWHPDHLNPKDGRKLYFPFGMPEILTEFYKLQEGDEEELLKFTHTYGFLGYWRFLEPTPPEGQPWLSAEPLEWIWWHHRTVRMALDLIEAVKSKDDDVLTRCFNRYGVLKQENEILVYRFQYAARGRVYDRGRDSEAHNAEGVESAAEFLAKWIVLSIINENTTTIRRKVFHLPGRPLWASYTFDALIEVIYWHLMEIVDGGRQIRRCKYCKTFFIATNAKKEFCPPPAYSVSQRKQSLCGAKYHMQNQRRKKDSGQ